MTSTQSAKPPPGYQEHSGSVRLQRDLPRAQKQHRKSAPGWYFDPWRRYPERWWTGLDWSAFVRRAGEQFIDALPQDGGAADELTHLHYLEGFLDCARTEHAISSDTYQVLLARAASRQASLAGAPAAPAAATALPGAQGPADGSPRLPSGPVTSKSPAAPSQTPAGPAAL